MFQFSRNIPCPAVCISHFSHFSIFLAIFHLLQYVFLIFHVFQCVLPYSTSYSVHFSLRFSVFLAIFQVLPSDFLIFLAVKFSCHIPGPKVAFLIFQVFHCFSPLYRSYSVCVSFSTFCSFSP